MNNPIVAISTAPGQGAIALVRLSGEILVKIVDAFFVSKQLANGLEQAEPNKQYFGLIKDNEAILDEVMLTFFRAPKSYTGEDLIEIACHGSTYIQQEIVALCLKNGAQLAEAGEFTFRAFINGKMDLSQAEAVADLIHSENEANHKIALQNMRGGFSSELKALRKNLVRLAALMELELDFSEEDVAFADRSELKKLLDDLKTRMQQLLGSFDLGNALKKGVPVAILGAPNAGKSSLLNLLLNEEKAIVSDIAGTTRDIVEDTITLSGISYRFIDTAGLRETTDTIETIGIQRALRTAEKAEWILYLYDEMQDDPEGIITIVQELKQLNPNLKIILVQNKIDLKKEFNDRPYNGKLMLLHENDFIVSHLGISTKENQGIEELKNYLQEHYSLALSENDLIINNLRHAEALRKALEGIERVEQGMHAQLPTDLLSFELRDVIDHLGKITGVIDPDVDVLGTLFGEFCVGK